MGSQGKKKEEGGRGSERGRSVREEREGGGANKGGRVREEKQSKEREENDENPQSFGPNEDVELVRTFLFPVQIQ